MKSSTAKLVALYDKKAQSWSRKNPKHPCAACYRIIRWEAALCWDCQAKVRRKPPLPAGRFK